MNYDKLEFAFKAALNGEGRLSRNCLDLIWASNLGGYLPPVSMASRRELGKITKAALDGLPRKQAVILRRMLIHLKSIFAVSVVLRIARPDEYCFFGHQKAYYLGMPRAATEEAEYAQYLDGLRRIAAHFRDDVGILKRGRVADVDAIIYALSTTEEKAKRLGARGAKSLAPALQAHLRTQAGFREAVDKECAEEYREICRENQLLEKQNVALSKRLEAATRVESHAVADGARVNFRSLKGGAVQLVLRPRKKLPCIPSQVVIFRSDHRDIPEFLEYIGGETGFIRCTEKNQRRTGREAKDKGTLSGHYAWNKRVEYLEPGRVKSYFVTRLGVTKDMESR